MNRFILVFEATNLLWSDNAGLRHNGNIALLGLSELKQNEVLKRNV